MSPYQEVSFSGQHFSGVTFSEGILDFGAGPHDQEVSLSGGLLGTLSHDLRAGPPDLQNVQALQLLSVHVL